MRMMGSVCQSEEHEGEGGSVHSLKMSIKRNIRGGMGKGSVPLTVYLVVVGADLDGCEVPLLPVQNGET